VHLVNSKGPRSVDVVLETTSYREGAWERVYRLHISAGEYTGDAGHGPGGGSINTHNSRVSMWAAQNGGMRHAGQHNIIHETSRAFDQTRVFTAL
jgi:hypothetical protein